VCGGHIQVIANRKRLEEILKNTMGFRKDRSEKTVEQY
jgi:hypothetical protein